MTKSLILVLALCAPSFAQQIVLCKSYDINAKPYEVYSGTKIIDAADSLPIRILYKQSSTIYEPKLYLFVDRIEHGDTTEIATKVIPIKDFKNWASFGFVLKEKGYYLFRVADAEKRVLASERLNLQHVEKVFFARKFDAELSAAGKTNFFIKNSLGRYEAKILIRETRNFRWETIIIRIIKKKPEPENVTEFTLEVSRLKSAAWTSLPELAPGNYTVIVSYSNGVLIGEAELQLME